MAYVDAVSFAQIFVKENGVRRTGALWSSLLKAATGLHLALSVLALAQHASTQEITAVVQCLAFARYMHLGRAVREVLSGEFSKRGAFSIVNDATFPLIHTAGFKNSYELPVAFRQLLLGQTEGVVKSNPSLFKKGLNHNGMTVEWLENLFLWEITLSDVHNRLVVVFDHHIARSYQIVDHHSNSSTSRPRAQRRLELVHAATECFDVCLHR